MPQVTDVRYGKLPGNVRWPQDTIHKPAGFGQLTRVDTAANRIRRDFFAYAARLSFKDANSLLVTKSFMVQQDADFWAVQMGMTFVTQDGEVYTNQNTGWFKYNIEDGRNNRKMFNPYTRAFFWSTSLTETEFEEQYWTRSPFVQPYPFVRDSSIIITLEADAGLDPTTLDDVYITLEGWKEYSNVSH